MLRISSVLAIAVLAVTAAPAPQPVALQYDEISRLVFTPATPPPAGSFAEDYQLAMNPQATSAPKRRGFGALTNIAGSVLSGGRPDVAGAVVNTAVDSATQSMVNSMVEPAIAASARAMSMLRNGHVTRYTYYMEKGWIREDDPLAQTATISKCRERQFITLDLAKKTYHIADTSPKNCMGDETPPTRSQPARPQHEEPGTVDLTVNASSNGLGPKMIDGIPANGYGTSVEMQMANATGSCRNGDIRFDTVSYVSTIVKPRAFCPLTTPRYVASRPADVHVTPGGCKPTFHGSANAMFTSRSRSDVLEMYALMSMSTGSTGKQGQTNRGSFTTLLERGHVRSLKSSEADSLFVIPDGFTAV